MYSRWCLTNMLYNQCLKTAKPGNLNFNDASHSFQRSSLNGRPPTGLTYINVHNVLNVWVMGIQQQLFKKRLSCAIRNYTLGKELGISRIISLLVVALFLQLIVVHLTNGKYPSPKYYFPHGQKDMKKMVWWDLVWCPWTLIRTPGSERSYFFFWHQQMSLCCGSG